MYALFLMTALSLVSQSEPAPAKSCCCGAATAQAGQTEKCVPMQPRCEV